MERKTQFDAVTVLASGILEIRLVKLALDQGEILKREYHRTVLVPGVDLDAQLAVVNQHLAEMNYPPVAAGDVERLRRLQAADHTPERVQQFHDLMVASARASGISQT